MAYAGNDNVCRSQQLLRYFGDDDVEECGHCDVCIKGRHESMTFKNDTVKLILGLLSDKQQHSLDEVAALDAPSEDIDKALRFLVGEGMVCTDVDKLSLGK